MQKSDTMQKSSVSTSSTNSPSQLPLPKMRKRDRYRRTSRLPSPSPTPSPSKSPSKSPNEYGRIPLRSPWTIWSKRLRCTKKRIWSEYEIIPALHLTTHADVANLFNHYRFNPESRFIFMKDPIRPIWEDEENIGAGYISLTFAKSNFQKLMMDLLRGLINNKIVEPSKRRMISIHGLSYTSRHNGIIIKLWCKPNINTNAIPIDFFTERYRGLITKGKPFTHVHFIPFESLLKE